MCVGCDGGAHDDGSRHAPQPFPRQAPALIRTLGAHTDLVRACAVSPDGSFIVSASDDGTLKVWDARTGEERATPPLAEGLHCVDLHSREPLVACGGEAGGVYLVDLLGIRYGPIIVTAADFGSGPTVRCPACIQHFRIGGGSLGQVIDCPLPGCEGRMRVNPFVTVVRRPPEWGHPWWRFWRQRR